MTRHLNMEGLVWTTGTGGWGHEWNMKSAFHVSSELMAEWERHGNEREWAPSTRVSHRTQPNTSRLTMLIKQHLFRWHKITRTHRNTLHNSPHSPQGPCCLTGMSVSVRHSSSFLSQSLEYVFPSFPHRGLYVPSHCMGSQEHRNSLFSSKHMALNLQPFGQPPGDRRYTYTCVNNVKNGSNRPGANQHWLEASLFLSRSIRHRILTHSGVLN